MAYYTQAIENVFKEEEHRRDEVAEVAELFFKRKITAEQMRNMLETIVDNEEMSLRDNWNET